MDSSGENLSARDIVLHIKENTTELNHFNVYSPCASDMDSTSNFYDTDFFGTETPEKNQKFLFESEPIDFNDEIGGLYEHENSIDFSQYIHQSGEQPNHNFDILQNFGLSTSPPKPHEFTLPPLINIKPDPDAPVDDLISEIDTAPCTPAVTDSNPASPRSNPDDTTGEHMPQIDELQDGEALPSTGNYYVQQGGQTSHQQLVFYQEPNETASEPSSAQSSPGGPRSKGGAKRARARAPVDKESEEYRLKRERNNIAVRKSRMKSKEKHVGLQKRVDELTTENSRLNKKVELLTKELTVLKSLFTNVGKQPPKQLMNALPQ